MKGQADIPMAERLRLFHAGRLPGQVIKFCPASTEFVNDLWRDREQMIGALRDAQMAMSNLPADVRKQYETRALLKISILIEEAKTK